MSSKPLLFIGGRSDGKRCPVPERQQEVHIAYENRPVDAILPPGDYRPQQSFNYETYLRRSVTVHNVRIDFFVLGGMKLQTAIERLLENYKP